MPRNRLRNAVLAVMVLLVVTAGTALAVAPGDPFRLGVGNGIDQITKLAGTVATAMLRITNNGSGPALELRVQPGSAPLTVNSATRVANLNADLVDGLDATAFLPVGGKAANADRLDGVDSTGFLPVAGKAADADRLDGQDSTAFLPVAAKAADADKLDGLDSTKFMGSKVTRFESATSIGTLLSGDTTRFVEQSCPSSSLVLSGGPNHIDIGTAVLDSFPVDTNTWRVRIKNDATNDSFTVAVLCASL